MGTEMADRPSLEVSGETAAHQKPESSTALSRKRAALDNERSLIDWIRTALSMISFGFTIGGLGEVFQEVEVKGIFRDTRTLNIQGVALLRVLLGIGSLTAATVQYQRAMRGLYTMGLERKFTIAATVAIVLVLIGALALSIIMLQL